MGTPRGAVAPVRLDDGLSGQNPLILLEDRVGMVGATPSWTSSLLAALGAAVHRPGRPMNLFTLRALVALSACLTLVACINDDTGEECAANNLIEQCPPGSSPVLGAAATNQCGGGADFSAGPVETEGSVVGSCAGVETCNVYCQFDIPCTCGTVSVSRDAIICAECPEQSCGDGRCEGTEREDCTGAPDIASCQTCTEDCSGVATCGDGDCTLNETANLPSAEGNPDLVYCPRDCADLCIPSEVFCAGNVLSVCSANGSSVNEVDCGESGFICAEGACVPAGVCGNEVCEDGEDPDSCPIDCQSSVCEAGTRTCNSETLVVLLAGRFQPRGDRLHRVREHLLERRVRQRRGMRQLALRNRRRPNVVRRGLPGRLR